MKKFKFSKILAFAAGAVACCAAYYSIFGLSQLFAGASLAVIIMASSLEFAKVVSVSFLQRYWGKVSNILRIYLTIGVVVLVVITSAGIYGFLTNAYQKTANKMEAFDGSISVLKARQDLFLKGVADNQKIIDSKNKRIDALTGLRANQESRLDGKGKAGTRGDIASSNKEIQKLTSDIDTLNYRNAVLSDSANVYSTKAIEAKAGSEVAGEVGPLKYIAQLTGQPMDKIINYFILLLVFVFDPLAVALVFATNRVMQLEDEYQPMTEEELKEWRDADLMEADKEDETWDLKPAPPTQGAELRKQEATDSRERIRNAWAKAEAEDVEERKGIADIAERLVKEREDIATVAKELVSEREGIANMAKELVSEREGIANVAEKLVQDKYDEDMLKSGEPETTLTEEEYEDRLNAMAEASHEWNVEPTPPPSQSIVEGKDPKPIRREAVIPTGKVQLDEIKEKRFPHRGFSVPVPPPRKKN